MSLGARIQEARLAAGFSKPIFLSRLSGISKQTLSNYENNKVNKPDPSTLLKIATYTNVKFEWLMTGEDHKSDITLISDNETLLLNSYKKLSETHKSYLLSYLEFLLNKNI